MRKYFILTVFSAITALLCCSCYSTPFEYSDMCELDLSAPLPVRNLAPWKNLSVQARMVIETPFYSTAVICMMQCNSQSMTLAAMLPAGVKFMEIKGGSSQAESWYFMPGSIDSKDQQQIMASALLQDFRRIFWNERFLYPGKLPGSELKRSSKGVTLHFPELGENRFYGSKQLRLMKKSVKNDESDWQSEYFRCNVKKGFVYPDRIVYYNRKNGYRLILRVYDFQAD